VIGPLTSRRWRRPRPDELEAVVALLEGWPAPHGGAVRHVFPLAAIDTHGAAMVRITGDVAARRSAGDAALGVVVRIGRDVLAVCGDGPTIARSIGPAPTWRLLVGDVAAADGLLVRAVRGDRVEHDQRYLALDASRVPDEMTIPDPGVRRAVVDDVDGLAQLAVQLHVDDGFGPDPGANGLRGYRDRLAVSVRGGVVDVVGPVGAPIAKLERSVDHPRYGVQLAGIVVDPAHRGRGIGRGLVAVAARAALCGAARAALGGAARAALGGAARAALGGAARAAQGQRTVTLHARTDNAPALAVYAAVGFVDVEAWRLAVSP
jgi:GNAT superfamily N-acetyltransferase